MKMTTLESLAKEVNKQLQKRKLKLVTAESCTGGGIGYWVTSIAGSSECYERGFITYSNEAKIEQLGVLQSTLNEYGAVSEQTAKEMAEGALKNSRANISISITGIAGPNGGGENKPVGTVWIGVAGHNQPTLTVANLFIGDRQQIREQSINKAFTLLLDFIGQT